MPLRVRASKGGSFHCSICRRRIGYSTLRRTSGCVLVCPVSVRFGAALASGSSFGFETGMESCFDTGRLRVPLGASELERRLVTLRRAARDAAMRGEHVLWLALGMLHWCEADATHAAPLWLVPVELDAANRLAPVDGVAPTFNHALAQKLKA